MSDGQMRWRRGAVIALSGVATMVGVVVVAAIAFLVLWSWGTDDAHRTIETIRGDADRLLVAGANRDTIEQFFGEREIEFTYVPKYLPPWRPRAYLANRLFRTGPLGRVIRMVVYVYLDDDDRLLGYELLFPQGGP
jgi:hypothetical protein